MHAIKKYPWILVALLWGVALLNYMDRQMLSTMKPAMEIDIVELQSATNFGYLMAIFLWVYGLMSPLSGIVADKYNRKLLIVGSLFVWSAVTLAIGYATSFNQLYVLRAIMGISEALYLPAALSLIAEYHSPKTRSLAIGIHMTGLYMGQALGGFGATIASHYSWQQAFHSFGLVGIIYAFVLMFLLKEKKQDPALSTTEDKLSLKSLTTISKGLTILFSNIAFWVLIFYFSVPSLPGWAVKNWLPTLFSQSLNIDMATAGPLSTIAIAISSFFGVILGGLLSDTWVQRNLKGRIYTSAIGLALTIPALMLLGFGDSLPHFLLATLCFGFGFGMFDANNMPILCQFVAVQHRATAYGILNMAGVFSGAFITNILGKYSDSGTLGLGFAMLGGLVLLAILMQLYFLKPKQNDFTADLKNKS